MEKTIMTDGYQEIDRSNISKRDLGDVKDVRYYEHPRPESNKVKYYRETIYSSGIVKRRCLGVAKGGNMLWGKKNDKE